MHVSDMESRHKIYSRYMAFDSNDCGAHHYFRKKKWYILRLNSAVHPILQVKKDLFCKNFSTKYRIWSSYLKYRDKNAQNKKSLRI